MLIVLMVSALAYSQDNGSRSGERSLETTPVSYTAPETAIFIDDMNGVNSVAGLEARGWFFDDVDGAGLTTTFQGNASVFTAYEGPDTGYVAENFNGAFGGGLLIDQWLISPEVTVAAGDTLKFWQRSPDGSTYPDPLQVWISTTAGTTAAAFDVQIGAFTGSTTGWWQFVEVFPVGGTIRFAVRYYTTNGGPAGTESDYIGLDLFEVISAGGGGYGLPEVLYYLFDETGMTSTQNFAVPGRGTPFADLMGGLTMGPTGQFDAALIGTGASSSTDYVNTGWITDIGTSDWTISMWINNIPVGSSTLYYLFGDNTAGSFRCFLNGVAGQDWIALRQTSPSWSFYMGPVLPGPTVVHWVYDSSVPEIRGYINGVFFSSLAVTALNITGAGPFKVGGYSSSTGLSNGGFMDEYRFYSRALDAAEIAATWNISVIPVELTSFTASVTGNNVTLDWETATEVNNSGFAIERKSANSEFIQIGFVPGFGTTAEPKAYTFTDNSLLPGAYSYRLKQIDFDGTFEYSDIVEVEVLTPDEFALAQNYPNPFNPSTKITFALAVDSKVSLKIFDVLGQEVTTLVNQDLTAGVHNYEFNALSINSGVYFYKIEATGVNGTEFVDVKKMILLK
jgi:hypothetical protein